MHVRLIVDGRSSDRNVTVHDAHATVADLSAALGWPEQALSIDGRAVVPTDRLERVGLGAGSILGLGVGGDPRPTAGGLTLTVTSGYDVGRQATLSPGRWVLGRCAGRWTGRPMPVVAIEDPRLSSAHAGLVIDGRGTARLRALTPGTVTMTGEPSTADSHRHGRLRQVVQRWLRRSDLRRADAALPGWAPTHAPRPGPPDLMVHNGSVARLGPVEVAFTTAAPPPAAVPPTPGAPTRPLHRRPRPTFPPAPEPITVPAPPTAPPAVTPIGVLAVLASLAVGGAMVLLLHSWAYAAFALLGPVLLVANALDSRRRRRRETRAGTRRRRRDLDCFDHQLRAAADDERRRRHRLHPGPGSLLERCWGPSPTCWNRRAEHPDAFAVRIGTGAAPWTPPLTSEPGVDGVDVAAVLASHHAIDDLALGVRLDPSQPIAVVGPRAPALALVRSLVLQAVVDHGPADLGVAVITDRLGADDWRWCTWLPHSRDDDGDRLLADHPAATEGVAARLLAPVAAGACRRTVVVIDDPQGLAARRSGARTLLRAATDPDRALVPIVLAASAFDVPAVCTIVLDLDDRGRFRGPSWLVQETAEIVGVGSTTADEIARRLARLDDPELEDSGRSLPGQVALAPLLPIETSDERSLAEAWRGSGVDPPPTAILGTAADGPLVIDLVADGPHVLVAGTTGSGKSELLRTLVASLAVATSPELLTFVLVDFKGGSAFDACARLPHTTGIVTDLDEHLAARALRCLEAELRHRERRLRAVGAADLTAFRARGAGAEPLPRLVVVVDEFATLAAELPDFVDALVGIAQRGRSLGVHLVLATQRPAGAVSDHIRANTGLRIALRVQDAADSRDVIDAPDAVDLPRHRPGRALARLGPGELLAFQTARVTGSTGSTGPVTAEPVPFGRRQSDPVRTATRFGEDTGGNGGDRADGSDLDRLVETADRAWQLLGGAPPRRPWPDPLPSWVEADHPLLSRASSTARGLVIGIADDPDHQRQVPFSWEPLAGPLLAVGLHGSGTTTAAATAVLAAAAATSAEHLHIHVIDLGSGGLRPLLGLAHVGAVVTGEDRERQRRLLAMLATDLAHRRATPIDEGRPGRLLVIDGLAEFRAGWDDLEPTGTWDHLLDLLRHGPAVDIGVVLTAAGSHAVPHQILAACHQRLVFRLADPSDHAAFGIAPAAVPSLPPGRALSARGEQLVQVTWPGDDLDRAVRRISGGTLPPVHRRPEPVPALPVRLRREELAAPAVHLDAAGCLAIAVGLADEGLTTVHVELAPGGHALIVGPPRSGRTNALRVIADAAGDGDIALIVVTATIAAWSGLDAPVVPPDDPELSSIIDRLDHGGAPLLVLVDDADRTADDHPVLASLAAERRPHRHLVAAARADRVRGAYAHWLREVQADRSGLLLHPDLDLDGDLLGIRLPRRPPLPLRPGRGWVVGAAPACLVQIIID